MTLHVIRNTWTEIISSHNSLHIRQDHVPLQLTALNRKYLSVSDLGVVDLEWDPHL